MRDDELTLLTTDHTLGAPGTTHALTRAVGAQDSLRVDHIKETAHFHDRYLICSDGVHGALSQQEIHRAARAGARRPRETALQLVERRGGHAPMRTTPRRIVLDVLALPATQFADLELAFADRPLRARAREPATWSTTTRSARCWPTASTRACFAPRDQRERRDGRAQVSEVAPGPRRAAAHRDAARDVDREPRAQPVRHRGLEPPPERRSCLYGVLPFYAGETLEQRLLRRPPITLAAGLDIAIKLAKAVAALHRAGIMHRDIKPENVILSRTAASSSSTSAWRACRNSRKASSPALPARAATWRPSCSTARTATRAPTSSRSA